MSINSDIYALVFGVTDNVEITGLSSNINGLEVEVLILAVYFRLGVNVFEISCEGVHNKF